MDTTQARRRLEEERERLLGLRDAERDIAALDQEQSEASGSLADYDQHPGDAGSETFERTKELAMEDQVEDRLAEVESALERVDAGSYGRCEACGRQIEPERLDARPAARYCLEHQTEADAQAEEARNESGPL